MLDPQAEIPPEHILPKDALGDFHVDKIVGKCPFCNGSLRAFGGWEKGVDMMCTNHRCQAGWTSD